MERKKEVSREERLERLKKRGLPLVLGKIKEDWLTFMIKPISIRLIR